MNSRPSKPNLRLTGRQAGGWLIVLACLALLVGCATETKQKWLTIFFDGVPKPGAATNAPLQTVEGQPASTNAVAQPVAPPQPQLIIHPPYGKRECTACHESQYSQKMKGKPGEVCFTCHQETQKSFAAAKVKHQPMENGECVSCHSPHNSANKKLLIAKGEKLCFECHEDVQQQLVKARVKHQPVENGECSSCHSPHQSDFKKLLIKPAGKLCFECHEDLQQQMDKAAFKHDPAGNGDCASCHNPHQSAEPALLIKDRRQVCFECHEEKDMAEVKDHADALQESCANCHDPHFGKDKYLLKGAAAKAEGKGAPSPK